jgi:hypothetical protein
MIMCLNAVQGKNINYKQLKTNCPGKYYAQI